MGVRGFLLAGAPTAGWGHGHRSFLVLREVIQERTPTSGEGKRDLLFFPGSSQAGAGGSF